MALELEALVAVARLGALRSFAAVPSRELGEALGRSQQSASRYLLELEGRGLVERQRRGRDQLVRLTGAGRGRLRALHRELGALLESEPASLTVRGRVASGLGEGAYYLSREGYRARLAEALGYPPYPGTLNVAPRDPSLVAGQLERAGTLIPGFEGEDRSFGAVRVVKASLRGVPCAVVLPERAHRADVLELVAERRLRDALGLADGDEVEVTVGLD